jgi:hypothetical protein
LTVKGEQVVVSSLLRRAHVPVPRDELELRKDDGEEMLELVKKMGRLFFRL